MADTNCNSSRGDAVPTDLWEMAGLGVACLLLIVGFIGTCVRVVPREDQLHDFVQEWTSGRNYFDGKPIYGDLSQAVGDYLSPALVPLLPIRVNAHPPVAVLATLPFAKLDYRNAVLVWNVLSLAALGFSLWLILSPAGLGFSARASFVVFACVLACSPLAHQLYMAQLNLGLLLLITGAWYADRTDRPYLSGILVGIATALKLFPGFLFLYFLARRRMSSFFAGVATVLCLNLSAVVVLGVDCYRVYVREVVPEVSGFRAAWTNASIMGFWAKLFDVVNQAGVIPIYPSPLLAKIGGMASVAVLAIAVYWKCRRTGGSGDLCFAISVIGMVLASPVAWHHYFVMLILPMAILWKASPKSLSCRLFLIGTLVLLAINPWWIMDAVVPGDGELAWWPGARRSVAGPLHVLTVVSFQFYVLLATFGFAFRMRTRGNAGIDADEAPVSPRDAELTEELSTQGSP